MIPLRLELTNFLSYGVMPEPLDLSQIHLACLSGPNGHGKSALLDAITWALWGKARGCEGGQDQERLIHDGADSMGVEFVFSLDDQIYRVARSRTKTGKADVTFNVQASDGTWTDLAGEGIADTQRRIIERLRMDYETFVASAFILQGRADTFTRLDPKDRKEVLGKILGLEVYERLADRAREKKKEAQADADAHARALETLQADLAGLADLETMKTNGAAALERAEKDRAEADSLLGSLRERATELRAVEAAAREAEKRRAEAEAAVLREDRERSRLLERVELLTKAATVSDDVREAAARIHDLETAEKKMDEARARHDELTAEASSLEQRLAEIRVGLETQRDGMSNTAARLETELATEAESRAVLERALQEIGSLDALETEREALQQEQAGLRERLAAIAAETSAREAERSQIAEKSALLDEKGAGCPLCGQDLTPSHRKEVRASFAARARELADADRETAKETKSIAARLTRIEKEAGTIGRSLQRRDEMKTNAAALAERLDRFRSFREELERARREIAAIAERLVSEDYGQPERDKLARVRDELAGVGFDQTTMRALKTDLERCRTAERAVAAAAAAQAELASCTREASAAEERRTRAAETVAAATKDLAGMGEQLGALPRTVAELGAAEAALQDAQKRVDEAGRTLAAATHALEALARKAEQATQVKAERASAKRTASLYDKLAKAFGRDGIPARIIGNAIPQLGQEANRLLGMLSDGQMTVTIDPIRETKSKTLKETLEIGVYDATGGKRAYEMYSGGERLRIDFALRVALSRLLATRAGTRLETLVVDEGFGSQDAEGRTRLLEAIMRVRSEFRTVLVITHIDDLKEHFPVRIEVRKDPQAGSRVPVI